LLYFAPFGGNNRAHSAPQAHFNGAQNGFFNPFSGQRKGMYYVGDFHGNGSHKPGQESSSDMSRGVFVNAIGGYKVP
jgi:hypothetical protein